MIQLFPWQFGTVSFQAFLKRILTVGILTLEINAVGQINAVDKTKHSFLRNATLIPSSTLNTNKSINSSPKNQSDAASLFVMLNTKTS